MVNEEPGETKQLERGAGTLTLVRSSQTLHGVLPVQGEGKRISAILSYDSKPDRIAPDVKNCILYGPRVEKILESWRRGL